VRRRSCITHCPVLLVKYFSQYEQMAPPAAVAKAAMPANRRMANALFPAAATVKWFSQPCPPHRAGPQYAIEDDLQSPRLQQVRYRLADDS
jgi:hypothetical protein